MNHRKQNGAVLAIGLILLLLMTLLGTMSLSRVNTSERLAGAERDINNAFQAAEAALLEGERWIEDLTTATPPDTIESCDAAECQIAIWDGAGDGIRGNSTTSWQKINWNSLGRSLEYSNPTPNLTQIAEQPRYVIEYIGPESAAAAGSDDMHFYRITSRARGTTGVSEVILQSTYKRPFP